MLIGRDPDDVFEFCRDGENFQRIFPERISPLAEDDGTYVEPGGEYGFRQWMGHVVPVRWQVRITRFEPGRCFSDEQLRGPFRYWRHTHVCEPDAGGTRYRDAIDYSTHLGGFLDERVVRVRIDQIFRHRQRVMKQLLEERA